MFTYTPIGLNQNYNGKSFQYLINELNKNYNFYIEICKKNQNALLDAKDINEAQIQNLIFCSDKMESVDIELSTQIEKYKKNHLEAFKKLMSTDIEDLSIKTIKDVHQILFNDISVDIQKGEFRTTSAYVENGGINDHNYYCFEIIEDELSKRLIEIKTNVCLQSIAKFYFIFLQIHPFEDGNGRVSRLLLNYFLKHMGHPFIIPTINRNDFKKSKKKLLSAICDVQNKHKSYDVIVGWILTEMIRSYNNFTTHFNV